MLVACLMDSLSISIKHYHIFLKTIEDILFSISADVYIWYDIRVRLWLDSSCIMFVLMLHHHIHYIHHEYIFIFQIDTLITSICVIAFLYISILIHYLYRNCSLLCFMSLTLSYFGSRTVRKCREDIFLFIFFFYSICDK